MRRLIVVTGLGLLSGAERWSRVIAPLQAELAESGLGKIPEFDQVEAQVGGTGTCLVTEVTVEVAGSLDVHGYAVDLVDRVLAAASVPRSSHSLPDRWRGYHCEEYFSGPWSTEGYFDEPSQTAVIVPLSDVYELPDPGFLVIGHSGWGGIDFGYRHGQQGLWAHYPAQGDFRRMASTLAELAEGWCSGKLSV